MRGRGGAVVVFLQFTKFNLNFVSTFPKEVLAAERPNNLAHGKI